MWLLMFGATVVVALSVAVLECPWGDLLLGGGPAVSASDIWRRCGGVELCGGNVDLLLGGGPAVSTSDIWRRCERGVWSCVEYVSAAG